MIALLALVFAALIALEIAVQEQVMMPSFAALERDDARTSMRRIVYALETTLESLEVTAADWGNWADVYRYVQVPNQEFLDANVTSLELKQLQVNALLIADMSGRLVASRVEDLESPDRLDLALVRAGVLPADFPWRRQLAEGRRVHGLLDTERGVMMIAAAPVLDGSGHGTPRGMVILGRLLTPHQLKLLGDRAQAQLSMNLSARAGDEDELSETARSTRVERAFRDIYGHPLLTLRVDVPRMITARGQKVVAYASACLVGAAVAVLVLLLVIVNRVVLGPLERVTRHAVALGHGADAAAPLNLPGQDEVARLAREFDRMVERLADTRRKLVDQSFRAGFAELAKGVLHNLGNAMTPSVVRLTKLDERLREAPVAEMELASEELARAAPGSERRADLEQFLRLGCRQLVQTLGDARTDVAAIQRQAVIVQSALAELMRSTRNDPVVESVSLPELVHQTLEIVPDACRQRLDIDADASLGRVGVVRVARTVLRMVLQNLIINAADAVRDAGLDRGVVRVAAEIVREDDRAKLHLECTDNGIGIPKRNLERVFEQGFSTKSHATNHGIGLHWCANAVAALGGRIWAVSEGEGLGASMHLLLPLAGRDA